MLERSYTDLALRQAMALLAIDSPTGFTEKAAQWVQDAFAALGYDARRTVKGAHGAGTVRLIQQAQHILVVRFRPDSQRQRLGLLADRLIRQQLQDPGQLQCTDGFIE